MLTHTLLYHGRAVLNGMKRMDVEKDDIHAKLMRNYAEVPDWWYASVGVLFMALAVVANEVRTSSPYLASGARDGGTEGRGRMTGWLWNAGR